MAETMTWKRKSPQAYRRQLRRRLQRKWSHAEWLQMELGLWRSMGLSGRHLRETARLAARYVVSGNISHRNRVHKTALAHARAIAARFSCN